MNYTDVFTMLWEFALSLLKSIQRIWEFLINPIYIGFNIDKVDNAVYGWVINWAIDLLNKVSFSFVPIAIFSGTTFIVLVIAVLVKKFIPMA